MQANHRKKLSAALAILMLSSQPVLASSLEAARSEAVQKKNSIRSNMAGTQSMISQTRGQVATVQAEIRALDAQITQVNIKIDQLNGEMQKLQAEIAQTKADLEAAKAELLEKKELYAKRLRAMYIANDRGYLDILLDSTDATSIIGNARMIRSIATSDRELIDEINAKVKEIEEKQALLAEQEKQLAQKQEQARIERSNFEAANAQKTGYMNSLMSNLSAYEAQYDAMLRESDAIESQIANLDLSIQKAKEEESARIAKQRAAAEEARREKEAAARKASRSTGRIASTRSVSVNSAPAVSNDVVSYGEKATPEAKTGEFYWPVPGHHRITSPFGYRIHPILKYRKLHTGVDIGAPNGTPVVSAGSGTVIASRFMSGYGNCIMIDHGGKVTVYAHLSSRAVSPGQSVSAGETIGYVGSTGMSTGAHLHFEVRVNGAVQNPLNYL